jgi:Domain of unknown function (DUF3576)
MALANASKIMLGLTVLLAAGCSTPPTIEAPPASQQAYSNTQKDKIARKYGNIQDNPDGITLFSNKPKTGTDGSGGGGPTIGVNVYLWRATLETIDFLPLAQADPFGGVIITDWYSPPETPTERFKLNVYILDRVLRADGVKVAVFRQTGSDGAWADATVDPKTALGIEDSILTRARELRMAALGPAAS